MKIKYEPRKRFKLPEEHQKVISKASRYQREILAYLKDKDLLFTHEKDFDEETKAFIGRRKKITQLAKTIIDNYTYLGYFKRVKVRYNKTRDEPSVKTLIKRKRKELQSREDNVYSIPRLGVPLCKSDIEFYRSTYYKNISSGMSKSMAETITTQKLREKLRRRGVYPTL